MKKLVFVFFSLFIVSMAMADVLELKARFEFESILVDVVQAQVVSGSESLCVLKFENGMVIFARIHYGPINDTIFFFIGKKYRVTHEKFGYPWKVDLIEETGIEPIDKAVRIRMEEMQKEKEKREEKQRKKELRKKKKKNSLPF